jgi:hypothetical protein
MKVLVFTFERTDGDIDSQGIKLIGMDGLD